MDVEVGRSRSSEFTWNCPYKEKVDLCGILWAQLYGVSDNHHVYHRIADHLIKFVSNYLYIVGKREIALHFFYLSFYSRLQYITKRNQIADFNYLLGHLMKKNSKKY